MISPSWYTTGTIDALRADYAAGLWASDDLLATSQALQDDFHWQSHSFSHLARDNLGSSDCATEDGGMYARRTSSLPAIFYKFRFSS